MHDLITQLQQLQDSANQALAQINAPALQQEITALEEQLAHPNVWNNAAEAQQKSKRLAKLKARHDPWRMLADQAAELKELAELDDTSMQGELTSQAHALIGQYESQKLELQLSGQFDDHDAILRLSAGAGGTDAQDWAEMLLRMYLRWAEKSGMKTELIEQSAGDEAGIKSAVVSVSGPFAYGKLQSEHGVHRLVRLSPFNSDNLRQTSFALVEVLPQIDAPEEVQIDDKDLKVDVFRAGGHGGQSVNTTDSAVRITHLPTGIVVSIQNERSQLQNRETALKVLRSKLAQLQIEQHQEDLAQIKGPTQSAEWGSQIRNYVLHPYKLVKDTRTKFEVRDADAVLNGDIDAFITAFLQTKSIT
ncbi:peptide chain release factor 2 [Candidatus Saccharibacteria bacterium]|nr:MAG: peptide chain release factor 2 [Candidatus Saccharibacteria bacterium]